MREKKKRKEKKSILIWEAMFRFKYLQKNYSRPHEIWQTKRQTCFLLSVHKSYRRLQIFAYRVLKMGKVQYFLMCVIVGACIPHVPKHICLQAQSLVLLQNIGRYFVTFQYENNKEGHCNLEHNMPIL